MIFIDSKYLGRLSYKLRNFKKKKDNYWNFSCPICGDSKKDKLKARAYVYEYKARLVSKCFNCGFSSNVGTLIKHLDSHLYNEYVLERYKEGASKYHDHADITEIDNEQIPISTDLQKAGSICLEDLPFNHPAIKYVSKRGIPSNKWHLLYFAPKFKTFVNNLKFHFPNVDNDIPRLIIPYFYEGKPFALQGRSFGKEEPKYLTIKLDETKEKIYGLDRVDYNKRIYIVEGPIDSLFLPNTIAVSGAGMDTPAINSLKANATLVMDNERRSKEIVNYIEKYIEEDYSVCMWPDNIKEKDINEMILAGKTSDQILKIINTNTYMGIEAKLKLTEWRKC